MLHELLAALCGFPGSIFCLNAKQEILVVDNLPFCHPGEKDILNRICRLATAHYRLVQFVRCHGGALLIDGTTTAISPPALKSGTYLRSFCVALDEVLLAPYTRRVVELESEILNDPLLTVSLVQCSLEKYQSVLPALGRLTDEITLKQAHGCRILDLIHSHAASGLPNVSSVLKRIQRMCHAVLIRSLTDWLLYGVLRDPFDEFFIAKNYEMSSTVDHQSESDPSKVLDIDVRKEISSRRIIFRLNTDLLPPYISLDVAKVILFVGESIYMFEQGDELATSINAESMNHSERSENGTPSSVHSISILHDKRETFARDLYEWQQNEKIQITKFESIVSNIRSCVAEHLWALVVENADLKGHLMSLKDYYLLGRGDLYTAFIEQADNLLNFPPTTNTQHLVRGVFRLIARSMLPENDAYFENFKLIVDAKKKNATGWSHLRLEYNAPRPIHIIFTTEILNDLNAVFQFLLYVKRVQLKLHQSWALRMHARHLRLDTGDPKKWHLRNCMAFFVDNLQYYLQVDVLENQYNVLMAKIEETRDFQQVQVAFHAFMVNIRMQTFLLMKPVFTYLSEFLDLCTSYCCLLHRQQSPAAIRLHANKDADTEKETLNTYRMQFKRYSTLLLKVLSGIRTHQVEPHVAQFLTRVNFNQYLASGQDSR